MKESGGTQPRAFSETNMVLSWRQFSQGSSSSWHVFTEEVDVNMFHFYFENENVIMRGKDLSKNSIELLAHLNKLAFEISSQKFTKDRVFDKDGQ